MNHAIRPLLPTLDAQEALPARLALIGEDFDFGLPAPTVDQPLPRQGLASCLAPSVAEALLKLPFVLPRAA